MTHLGRAPREVYRVYGEEEFWAHAEQELITPGGEAGVDVANTPGRLFRRALVSTLLLSTVGAVGVLAITTRAPRASRGGVVAGARLLAAARSLISVSGGRAHVWQPPHPATSPVFARSRAALAARVVASARTVPPGARTGSPANLGAPGAPDTPLPSQAATAPAQASQAAAQATEATAQATEAPRQPPATSAVESPPRAPAPAAAAAPAAEQGQSEFGFER